LLSAVAIGVVAAIGPGARAASQEQASSFIDQTTKELTQTVNSAASDAEKKATLEKIIDRTVDVAGVAKFCLGRFWHQATSPQQQEYVRLFHRVLVINITGKIGDYKGVSVALGKAVSHEGDFTVSSIVNRPGNAPSKVDWIVSDSTGSLKIIDVIAEGTSLRITQRNDYSAYLSHNNNSVQALIDAMRQQASQQG
jgi:phospholipid transport system substrate-binding protein